MRMFPPALLLLAACTGEPEVAGTNQDAGGEAQPAAAVSEPLPAPVRGDMDPREGEAARQVLRQYFELVDQGRDAEARDLWWDADQAAAFAERLREFRDYEPNIADPGRVEGAAGSAYVEISLQLIGPLKSGREVARPATAVLRRVNDVPGSTAQQRRWRIVRISLGTEPVPLARTPASTDHSNGSPTG